MYHLTYQIDKEDKEKREVEKEMFTIPIHEECGPYTSFQLNTSDNYMLITHIHYKS